MRTSQQRRNRPYERLHVTPITLREARSYVDLHHRHLHAPAGGKIAIAVADAHGRLRGVAILGRPVARHLDTGSVLEVTRVATDGCANACSALYGCAQRLATLLGYARVITYTRGDERGTSLRAAGWTPIRRTRGGAWSRLGRSRRDSWSLAGKRRWEHVRSLRRIPAVAI
jgi:hypothetical protein